MYNFADIMGAAQMINDPTVRLNFMLKENSKLPESERLDEDEVRVLVHIYDEGNKCSEYVESDEDSEEHFDEDEMDKILNEVELPKDKKDKPKAALEFAREHLVKYNVEDVRLYIRFNLKSYFSLSVSDCDDIIKEVKKRGQGSGRDVELRTTEDMLAMYKAELSNIEQGVNSEVFDQWSKYILPFPEKGIYKIDASGITRVFPALEKFTNDDGEKETREVAKTVVVCRSPLVLCGKSTTDDGKHTLYKVRYCETGSLEIKEAWVEHSEIMVKTSLSKVLGSLHINCPDNDLIRETLEYISTSLAQFGSKLKPEFSATKCGWNEDNTKFVLGSRAVTLNGVEPVLMVNNYKYDELNKKGTRGAWIKATKPLMQYNIIRFRIYDAGTAVIGKLVHVEGHCSDHYGDTSEGKTLLAKIAISMYGNPNEGMSCRADSTAKSILNNVEKHCDLPFLIDETGMAKDDFPEVIYGLTNEAGRTKLDKDGELKGGVIYRTTALLTGEHMIRDVVKNSGQMVRVLEFDDTVPTLDPNVIKCAYDTIKDNYGHFVDEFVYEVMRSHASGELKVLYDDCFNALPDVDSKVEGRSKKFFALIMVSGILFERVFAKMGIEAMNPKEIVSGFFEKCISDRPIEMEHVRALRILLDWVESDYGSFTIVGKNSGSNEIVMEGNGFKRYGYVDDDFIDVIGTCLTDKLDKQNGIKTTKVKERLAREGIIAPKVGKNWQFSREGKPVNGIRIFRQKAEELLGFRIKTATNDARINREESVAVYKTIIFLEEMFGVAHVDKIRCIMPSVALDSVLNDLVRNNRVTVCSAGAYKTVERKRKYGSID
jgi:hypothetical protein